MIFAKLDVCMWGHPKFIAAGPAACGYWAAALAYLRGHDSDDGVLPKAVLKILLGVGEKEARKLCRALVQVGLFAVRGDEFELVGYAGKNETKAQIEARRAATRERVQRFRGVNRASSLSGNAVTVEHVTPPVTPLVAQPQSMDVPGSGSDSGSDSDLDQTRARMLEVRGLFGLDGQAWAEGVTEGTGRPCRSPTVFEVKDFIEPSGRHSGGLTGQTLVDWFRAKGRKFAQSVNPKYGFGPKHFASWLDRGEPTDDAVRVAPRLPEMVDYEEPDVPMPRPPAALFEAVGMGGGKS